MCGRCENNVCGFLTLNSAALCCRDLMSFEKQLYAVAVRYLMPAGEQPCDARPHVLTTSAPTLSVLVILETESDALKFPQLK